MRSFLFFIIIIGLIETRRKGKLKWSIRQYINQIVKENHLENNTSCNNFVTSVVDCLCENKKEAKEYLSYFSDAY